MVVVLSSHAVSTSLNYHHIMTESVSSSIALGKCTKLKKIQSCITADEHNHVRRCEQLIKNKCPQCAPANLETSCLFEFGDIYWKSQLRCDCQFHWCALAHTALPFPQFELLHSPTRVNSG
jgi:hypothetical protein